MLKETFFIVYPEKLFCHSVVIVTKWPTRVVSLMALFTQVHFGTCTFLVWREQKS